MEKINLEGWKGKDSLEIKTTEENYTVIEHRKSKESGEVYEQEHLIPKENVRQLWRLIVFHCQCGEPYGYKYIIRKLIQHHKFNEKEDLPEDVLLEAFNGGKYRKRLYFPYYYYPMKILESKGVVTYKGRGGVIRNCETWRMD